MAILVGKRFKAGGDIIRLPAGAPMWLLGWVAYPAMSTGLAPVDAGLLRAKLLTAGLIWQFVLAMIILYREEGDVRLSTISRRFWLNHPVSASTGKTWKAFSLNSQNSYENEFFEERENE